MIDILFGLSNIHFFIFYMSYQQQQPFFCCSKYLLSTFVFLPFFAIHSNSLCRLPSDSSLSTSFQNALCVFISPCPLSFLCASVTLSIAVLIIVISFLVVTNFPKTFLLMTKTLLEVFSPQTASFYKTKTLT